MAEMYGADTDEFLAQLNSKTPLDAAAPANHMSRVNLMGGGAKTTEEGGEQDITQSNTNLRADVEKQGVQSNKVKKTWSELDKYIELLLDSKQTDQSVFVYLNPNANGNPYDLQVC